MLPQPPPNEPAPPPSAAALRSRRFRLGIWTVGLASVLCLGIMLIRAVVEQRNKANMTEAVGNLRSMSLAFYEFDSAYGTYPNAETATMVRDNTESKLPLGAKSSNGIFRQLIAAEICQSESMFYAEVPGVRKPDNVFTDGSTALVKGEVGYSYIVGQSSKSNPQRPLVVTPLIPGTNKFDRKPFDGNAIVLRIKGGPVEILPIDNNGEVIDSSGKHILDPANPIWGGEVPVIAWPE